MAFKLDAKIPAGALAEKWSNHKAAIKVVSPANKRKLDIIIVGTMHFRRGYHVSLAHPTVWNIDHTPCVRWNQRAKNHTR